MKGGLRLALQKSKRGGSPDPPRRLIEPNSQKEPLFEMFD